MVVRAVVASLWGASSRPNVVVMSWWSVVAWSGGERALGEGLRVHLHISKVHRSLNEIPVIMPGEGILAVEKKGGYVDVRIRMKATLWRDIEKRARDEGKSVEHVLFELFEKLAAFGLSYNDWLRNEEEKRVSETPTYIQ